ncbi:MAG: DUF1684 domain-containing protein [Pedobacter sp.]
MESQINKFKAGILLALLFLIAVPSFAQNYKAGLEKHREEYRQAFLSEKGSPLKQQDLINLSFYEPDSTYLVHAKVEILTGEEPFLMPTYSGNAQPYIRYAKLKFSLKGNPQELTLYRSIRLSKLSEFKDHLFLPFTDSTNSKESYSGGRYIDLSNKEIEGEVIKVDFNKAYNPYCAYSDGYQCPKPPAENAIREHINAGEKAFSGAKKK